MIHVFFMKDGNRMNQKFCGEYCNQLKTNKGIFEN